jgi:hypothetical protein|tara:strand:+ start:2505 stop:2951 length:447 start_codon:yes stop_codon:yes gene_type:complete
MHTQFFKRKIDDYRVWRFLSKTRVWLNYHDIDLQLIPQQTVYTPDNDIADGFFYEPQDGERGMVRIATSHPQRVWLTTLGHELGHVHQYINGCPLYENGGYPAEADAERRAQRMMIENKLPVNPLWHTELTNEYLESLRRNPYKPGER